jgi:hypothetical protein
MPYFRRSMTEHGGIERAAVKSLLVPWHIPTGFMIYLMAQTSVEKKPFRHQINVIKGPFGDNIIS